MSVFLVAYTVANTDKSFHSCGNPECCCCDGANWEHSRNTTNTHSSPVDWRPNHFPGVLAPSTLFHHHSLLFAATGCDAPPPHAPGNYGNGSSMACRGAGARSAPSGDLIIARLFDKARLRSLNVLVLSSARPGRGTNT